MPAFSASYRCTYRYQSCQLEPQQSINQSARLHHQASIIDRAFSQIIVGSSQPSSPSAAAKRDTPSPAPRCLRCRWLKLQRPGSPSRSSAEHRTQQPTVIVRSSEYSVRFHASIRERSSLISRSKDAAGSVDVTGAQLRTIARRWARAFLQPRHHKHVASGPNAAAMRAAEPCPSHKAAPCSCSCSITGLAGLPGYTGRRAHAGEYDQAPLPHSELGSCNAACTAFTGPVGLHPYRQGAKPSQHSAACSILATVRGPGPGRPRDQQGTVPQHHRLHRCPPVDDATHQQEVPRSNLLTDLGSRIAPKFGIFFGRRLFQGPGLEASRALCLSSAQLRHPDIIYQDRCSRALC